MLKWNITLNSQQWAWWDKAEYLSQILWAAVNDTRRRWGTKLTECIACHRSAGRIGNPIDDGFAWHDVAPSIDLNFVVTIVYPEVHHAAVAYGAARVSRLRLL